MADISWLTSEAQQLHGIFNSLFYALVTVFLVVGVFVEYFRWPLGQMPSFSSLVGRALVAAIMLHCYTDITNTVAEVTDALAARVGNFNQIDLVISKLADKLEDMSASWVSVKETITIAISYISFFALYFSKYVAEGIFLFTWILCYVFSPILIALFVLPATAGATKSLFRTIFEISTWKIVWSVLATLVWSSALTTLNQPGSDVNFVSVICMNLALAGSLLLTPWVVHALANSGLSGFTKTLGGIAVGASFITPDKVLKASKSLTTKGIQTGKSSYSRAREFYNDNRHRMSFVKAPLAKVAPNNGIGVRSNAKAPPSPRSTTTEAKVKTESTPMIKSKPRSKDDEVKAKLQTEYHKVEKKIAATQPSLKKYQHPDNKKDGK